MYKTRSELEAAGFKQRIEVKEAPVNVADTPAAVFRHSLMDEVASRTKSYATLEKYEVFPWRIIYWFEVLGKNFLILGKALFIDFGYYSYLRPEEEGEVDGESSALYTTKHYSIVVIFSSIPEIWVKG